MACAHAMRILARSSARIARLRWKASPGFSVGAGVMALWSEAVPREWVGTVALLPALCATVAMQLRLNEKGNFSYRRYRAFHALARRVEVARLRAPTLDTVEAFNAEHAAINDSLDEQWVENLNFNFNPSARD